MAKRPVARHTSEKSTNSSGSGWFRRFASEANSIPKSTTIDNGFNDLRLDVLYDRFSEAEEDRSQIFQGTRQDQDLEFFQAEASRNAIEEARTKEFTKLLVQIKSRFQDAHSARVVVLKEVDEQCNTSVQKEVEKQLVVFEHGQKNREREFSEALDTYRKHSETLATHNEEFLNTERTKRDDAYKLLVAELTSRLNALIAGQEIKFSEAQRGRDTRIKDLLATRERLQNEAMAHNDHDHSTTLPVSHPAPTQAVVGQPATIHVPPSPPRSPFPTFIQRPPSARSFSQSPTLEPFYARPGPTTIVYPGPPVVTVVPPPPNIYTPEEHSRSHTPLIIPTIVTPGPDRVIPGPHDDGPSKELPANNADHSSREGAVDALEIWHAHFVDAERERQSIFLNDIVKWEQIFRSNETERDRVEHERYNTFREWEGRHNSRFSALEELSENFVAVQKSTLSAQDIRRSTEFQVAQTKHSNLFEDLTTWFSHRYRVADVAQDRELEISRNRVEQMMGVFRDALGSLFSRQRSEFDDSVDHLPFPSWLSRRPRVPSPTVVRPYSPFRDGWPDVAPPIIVAQPQGDIRSESPPIWAVRPPPTPPPRPVSPVYPAGPFVPQTLFAQGSMIPSTLPIPKVADFRPRAQPRKTLALSSLQQQHYATFNASQLRRQARYQAEMKRHHNMFVINDLARDRTFQINQGRRAEAAERREDEQSQQFEELIESKHKDIRLLVVTSHTDFRASESSRERRFLDDQTARRSQFVASHEDVQTSCYQAEEKRILSFIMWEGEIRASAESLVRKWRSQFEEAERAHNERFESTLAMLKPSML